MLAHLPNWKTDHFTIQARGPMDSTTDQTRLTMLSLLADRFGLKVHFETRVPVLVLAQPCKLRPKLRPHSEVPTGDKMITVPPVPTVYPLQWDTFSLSFDGENPSILGSRDKAWA
jgi:uncharacterized protein (TIGR03435 family)